MAAPIYPTRVTLCAPGPEGTPLGAAATPLPTQSAGFKSTVTITRPSNTTALTAGDAMGQADGVTPANAGTAILEFASLGLSAGHIIITGGILEIDRAALISGETGYRLHLYDAAPDAILDNAAWDLSSAGDRGKYLGYIDFRTPLDLGSTLIAQEDAVNCHRKLATGATSLFGVLQTIGAYTPQSGTVHKITLRALAA